MHKDLHLKDNKDRHYVSRKEGGRGLNSIKDCIDPLIQGFKKYIKKNKQRLITTANNSISDTSTVRKPTKLGNRNGKKNNSTYTSSDKLMKLHREGMDIAKKGKC